MEMIALAKAKKALANSALGKSIIGGLIEQNNSQVIHIISDSTANDNNEWAYLLAQKIASAYPGHNVKYKLFAGAGAGSWPGWTNIQSVGEERYYESVPTAEVNHDLLGMKASEIVKTSGDLDVTVTMSMADWQAASATTWYFLSQIGDVSATDWRWAFSITNNIIKLTWTPDGNSSSVISVSTAISTSAWIDGQAYKFRVKLDVDDGAGKYVMTAYTAPVGSETYTLVATVPGVAITSIYAPTTETISHVLGGRGTVNTVANKQCKFYEIVIRDGIDGPIINPQPIDAWRRIGTYSPAGVFGGKSTIYIYNASVAGYGLTQFKESAYLSMAVPKSYGALVLYSLGHNDSNYDVGSGYATDLDNLFTVLGTKAINATKVMITQNPLFAPYDAYLIINRSMRRRSLMGYAQLNKIPIIDTYVEFLNDSRGVAGLLSADGIHPNPEAGQPLLRDTIWSQLGL